MEPQAQLLEPESGSQHAATLSDFFRRYQLKQGKITRDILEGRYHIQVDVPLPEFDRRTVRAYAVADAVDTAKQLFALICPPGSVPRHNLIQPFKTLKNPHLLNLVAAGWVPLSQPEQERFVLVYERPPSKKISDLIGTVKISEDYLNKKIIAPLAMAIDQLARAGISHGAVRPDNIYMGEMPVLGDCIAVPCGYDQPFQFEPIERMQALPAGKGQGSTTQDYYALGVTVLTLLHGPDHFTGIARDALITSILREGVYTALTRSKETSEVFYDFFRGLLCPNADDRWTYTEIKPWLDGKRFNVLLPPAPVAARPFEFGDRQASSRRELAHVLNADWERILPALEGGQMAQWIAVSLRDKALSEAVSRVSRSAVELAGKNELQFNEQIMRLLLLLDPAGPIRIGPLAMHPDGMDTLCAELFMNKAEKELTLMARFIEFNLLDFWLDLQRKNPGYVISDATNAIMMKLEKLRMCIRNTGYGFGIERMVYDLNPDLPCQSPLLAGHQIATIPFLLATLDQLAPSMHGNEDPLDRHIAAFISSKANIQYEIKLHELSALPALASHRAVIALKLLAIAHQKTDNLTLPGLTHWLALRIAPALESIRSRTLRASLKQSLVERARSGSLPLLADLIINASYVTADQTGFSQAYGLYQANVLEIADCRKVGTINRASEKLGLAMAKLFAFIVLGVTAFSIFKGGLL